MDNLLDAIYAAAQVVNPIVEKHPLQKQVSGNILVHASSYSPAEQHIDLILRVADWLLDNKEH